MPRSISRRESKELTRRRLIDGAMNILRTEGVDAATTGRIAREAGIKQSSFYGHFADRDECLHEVAQMIGGYVLHNGRKHRGLLDVDDLRGSIRRGVDAVVAAFMSEPQLTAIFLRHRTDDSALGRCFESMVATARGELSRDLRAFGVAHSEEQGRVYAELLTTGMLGIVAGLIDGRLTERETAIDGLTDVTHAALRVAMKREGRDS
jgi:AcrR family transcriptional regulator